MTLRDKVDYMINDVMMTFSDVEVNIIDNNGLEYILINNQGEKASIAFEENDYMVCNVITYGKHNTVVKYIEKTSVIVRLVNEHLGDILDDDNLELED